MSTKIHNGFRVHAGDALANLNLLSILKPQIQTLVDKKMAKVTAERIAEKVDRFCELRHLIANGELSTVPEDWEAWKGRSVWWSVFDELLEKQRECRKGLERSPLIDCDVELFLRADPDTGMLLGYLQEERVGVYELLCNTEGIQDYGFWNNTDKPEELSDEEWAGRAEAWERVLDNDRACLTLSWEPTFGVDPNDCTAFFPSHEDRAALRAKYRLQGAAIRQWQQELNAQGKEEPKGLSHISRLMRETAQAMSQEGGALVKEFEELTALYLQILPSDLGEHLRKKFVELPEH